MTASKIPVLHADAVDAGLAQSYSGGQRMPSEAVHGRAGDGNEASELVAEESAGSVSNAEPAQKNGKRRRGGRVGLQCTAIWGSPVSLHGAVGHWQVC